MGSQKRVNQTAHLGGGRKWSQEKIGQPMRKKSTQIQEPDRRSIVFEGGCGGYGCRGKKQKKYTTGSQVGGDGDGRLAS